MAKKTTPIGPWIVVATVIVGFFCIFGCVLAQSLSTETCSGSGVVVADADPLLRR
ncbi:MAG: hypothetical protein R2844_03830 [Caldilineales bacterium]